MLQPHDKSVIRYGKCCRALTCCWQTHTALACRGEAEESDEASFAHLCKHMKTTYGNSASDLAVLKTQLVVCKRRDRHAFYLKLQHGEIHSSMKQLQNDWEQRKAADPELQGLIANLEQSSDGQQAATVLTAQGVEAPEAQTSHPEAPQIPVEGQLQGRQLRQTRSQSHIDSQSKQQSNFAMPDTPTPLHQNVTGTLPRLSSSSNQAVTTAAHCHSDRSPAQVSPVAMAQLTNSSRDTSHADQLVLTNNPQLQALDKNTRRPADQAGRASKAPCALVVDKPEFAVPQSTLAEVDVAPQIESLHNALKDIFWQQMHQKSDALCLQQLQAQLTALENEIQSTESRLEKYSKMSDLHHSAQFDNRDDCMLAEMLDGQRERAKKELANLQQQQNAAQTQLEQAINQLKGFQDDLTSQLSITTFEWL